MTEIIHVIEVKVGGKVVYKMESSKPIKGNIEFSQYQADALTGKRIEEEKP